MVETKVDNIWFHQDDVTCIRTLKKFNCCRWYFLVFILLLVTDGTFQKEHPALDTIYLVVNTDKNTIAGTRWKRRMPSTLPTCTSLSMEDGASHLPVGSWNTTRRPVRRVYKVSAYEEPQGSVLSPLLWNITFGGLVASLPRDITVLYADDVAAVFIAKYL